MKTYRQKHQTDNQTSTNGALITPIRNYRSSPVDREREERLALASQTFIRTQLEKP